MAERSSPISDQSAVARRETAPDPDLPAVTAHHHATHRLHQGAFGVGFDVSRQR